MGPGVYYRVEEINVTQTDQHWSAIESVVKLHKEGRDGAARSVWDALEDEFKAALFQYAIDIVQSSEIETCPTIEMSSKWGSFTLSPVFLTNLREICLWLAA